MLADLLSLNIFAFLLIFVRLGTFFMVAPGFSGTQVNPRIRLLIALAFTFLVTPPLSEKLPSMPDSPFSLGALIAGEVVIGAFIASVARIMFAAVQVAGTVAAFVSAMANSLVFDPITQGQSAIVAGFMGTIVTLLLFVTNLHLMLLQAMVDSYELFPPGVLPPVGDMADIVARTVSGTMKLGVQLASPLLIVAFSYYLGLGLLTRLEPQIPIFLIGMPLQIIMALATLMMTISGIALYFMNRFEEGMRPFLIF